MNSLLTALVSIVALSPMCSGEESRVSTATSPIRNVRVGNPITVNDNQGDTWVVAWADDGSAYTPSNDTFGFHGVCNSNIAFNRITGDDPLSLTGETVNTMADYGVSSQLLADGCNWKSTGCAQFDGILYWAVSRAPPRKRSGTSMSRRSPGGHGKRSHPTAGSRRDTIARPSVSSSRRTGAGAYSS